jgi:hypothetical protein
MSADSVSDEEQALARYTAEWNEETIAMMRETAKRFEKMANLARAQIRVAERRLHAGKLRLAATARCARSCSTPPGGCS